MLAVHDNDILNDQADETQRQAYNAAFDELGLSWHWDAVTYACLPAQGRDRLRAYLEKEQSHLLRAYEAEFLINAIETAKDRCHQVMVSHRAHAAPYPGHVPESRAPA